MQALVGFCSLVSILHLGDISPQEGHDCHVSPLPRWGVIGEVPESEWMPCRIPVAIFRIKKSAVWKHVHAVAVVAERGVEVACVALQPRARNRPLWHEVARHSPQRRRRVVAARIQCDHVSPQTSLSRSGRPLRWKFWTPAARPGTHRWKDAAALRRRGARQACPRALRHERAAATGSTLRSCSGVLRFRRPRASFVPINGIVFARTFQLPEDPTLRTIFRAVTGFLSAGLKLRLF